jgi:SAM-dependent methyltransferase
LTHTLPTCPVCGAQALQPFLHRNAVPVHQNLVVDNPQAACSVARGLLDFAVCNACGFVCNRAFNLSLLSYGEDYDNTQSCSAYFDAYLDALVRHLVEKCGLHDCTIVEVGCGKGQFLRKLVDYPGANNRGFGFDPSYVGPDIQLDGRLQFRRCYYDDTCTDVRADAVICRHVIEHVPQPLALLRSVRAALAQAPQAKVFFETPCVEWILRHRVVWDFFYEHCSLFSAASLRSAFEQAGFAVNRVDTLFNGQYLWLEAQPDTGPLLPIQAPPDTVALALAYGAEEQRLRQLWLARLHSLRAHGKIALWGAGAKGATLANLLDPDGTLIDCVIDINPRKQGRYLPGTGHPIVAPAELPRRGVLQAILMNPNYRQENLQLLAQAHIALELIDWSES